MAHNIPFFVFNCCAIYVCLFLGPNDFGGSTSGAALAKAVEKKGK